MSFFGGFLGKKKDPLAEIEREAGMPPGGGMPGGPIPSYGDPLGSPDPGFGEMSHNPMSQPPVGNESSPEAFGFEKVNEREMSNQHQETLHGINLGKDMEIISAKLDAIKAELDSMNQRLKRMERLAEGETSIGKDKWSY